MSRSASVWLGWRALDPAGALVRQRSPASARHERAFAGLSMGLTALATSLVMPIVLLVLHLL